MSGGIESSYYASRAFIDVVLMSGIHSDDEQGISSGEDRVAIRTGDVASEVPSPFSSTSGVFVMSSGVLDMSAFSIVLQKNIGNGCNLIYISGGGSIILNSMIANGG